MKPLSKLTSQQKKTAPGEFSHEIGDQLAIGRLWFIRIFQIGKHHHQKPSPVNEDESEMLATVNGREAKEYKSEPDISHEIRGRVKTGVRRIGFKETLYEKTHGKIFSKVIRMVATTCYIKKFFFTSCNVF